jgi:hypothetical protein
MDRETFLPAVLRTKHTTTPRRGPLSTGDTGQLDKTGNELSTAVTSSEANNDFLFYFSPHSAVPEIVARGELDSAEYRGDCRSDDGWPRQANERSPCLG